MNRKLYLPLGLIALALVVFSFLLIGGQVLQAHDAEVARGSLLTDSPPAPTNPYSDVWLEANHGRFDNIWTAEYETRLQSKAAQPHSPIDHC